MLNNDASQICVPPAVSFARAKASNSPPAPEILLTFHPWNPTLEKSSDDGKSMKGTRIEHRPAQTPRSRGYQSFLGLVD